MRQIAVAKGAFEPTDFMDHTALLLGVGQMGRQRGGQSGAAITHDHLHRRRIQAAPISVRSRSDQAAVSSAAAA